MKKRNTKQEILVEALKLFSVRGYDGVSVRDIAQAVGIRDSSLYKHYQSKQEIFEKLLDGMNERFEQTVAFYKLPQGDVMQVADDYGKNNLEWLKKAVRGVFLFFIEDEYAIQFVHLLMIEKFKNNGAAKMFEEWFITGALSFQTDLFEQLMERGYFKKADAHAVAIQFYGPVFLLILMYDSAPEKKEEALALLDAHIVAFEKNYHISYGENNEY